MINSVSTMLQQVNPVSKLVRKPSEQALHSSSALSPLSADVVQFSRTAPIKFAASVDKYGLDDMTQEMSAVLKDYLENTYRDGDYAKLMANHKKPPTKTANGKEVVDYEAMYDPLRNLIKDMGDLGVLGVDAEAEYGGLELPASTGVELVRQFAYEDAGAATSVLLSSYNGLFGKPIAAHGTDDQKNRYLPEIISGEKVGAFALTEPKVGSDPGAVEAKAVRKGDKWVINGEKIFITNGNIADYYIVLAQTRDPKAGIGVDKDGKPSKKPVINAFIVHRDDVGKIELGGYEKLGQHSSDTASVAFIDVEIPADRLVGGIPEDGVGKKIYQKTLTGGRIGVAAMATGVAERAIDEAVAYAKDRKQGGTEIVNYPLIRQRIADMATKTEIGKLYTFASAQVRDENDKSLQAGGDEVDYTRIASMAKLFATEHAAVTTDSALQVFGGNGFMEEYPAERLLRDQRVFRIYEGSTEIQKLIIAMDIVGNEVMNDLALTKFNDRLQQAPQTISEVLDYARASLVVGLTAQLMAEMNNGTGMRDLFNSFQAELGALSEITTNQKALELIDKQAIKLGAKGKKEAAMARSFAWETAVDAVKKANDVTGKNLFADTNVVNALKYGDGTSSAKADRELIAKAVIGD